MNNKISDTINGIVLEEYGLKVNAILLPTNHSFGDISTNIALQISSQISKSPPEIANFIAEKLKNIDGVNNVEVAGPGFINIVFDLDVYAQVVDEILGQADKFGDSTTYENKIVVAEYSDPNPFKVLHAGHLYTSLVGDSIANLLESAGAKVHRVNFGGDVGLHVAKTMWSIIEKLNGEKPDELNKISENERLDWISARYVEGNDAYENDSDAKQEIISINKRVYSIHEENDHDSAFAVIYWTCRGWSYKGFDKMYQKLAMSSFEKYYPESATTPIGIETVSDGLAKGVFEKSDGAVVYAGERYGLHTRVFLTSEGLPTYEAKDLGLAIAKWQDYSFDISIMITGNDIVEYMKVVQSALSQFHHEISERTQHLTHGIVKLEGGAKMSSRKGNILRAEDILDSALKAYQEETSSSNWDAVLAAIKYAFLKQRIGGDIIYNPKDSVNITGNSGPYLQYSHARAKSIVNKSDLAPNYVPDETERELLKKLDQYKDVLNLSVNDLMPHYLANYLFELSQIFNSFYEKERVIGSSRQEYRVRLVAAYAQVLKNGLKILGIKAPERM